MGLVGNDVDFDGEHIFQVFKVMDQSAYFG
jgi:hypothetical protein